MENKKQKFIDLFAGCGGFSLGLAQAGWQGVFAVEKTADAFKTFKENFLDGPKEVRFEWPGWLAATEHSIETVLDEKHADLEELRGEIDLIAGGPPCQGFSFAGRRDPSDPRNMMFEKYVHFVELVRPRALVLENVPGMLISHGRDRKRAAKQEIDPDSYFAKLKEELERVGYVIDHAVLNASEFGVPQRRERLIVIGLRKELASKAVIQGIFERTKQIGKDFQCKLNAGKEGGVSVEQAISDLLAGEETVDYAYADSKPGFKMAVYRGPSTPYQRAMHVACTDESMDSMRLANHRPDIADRFKGILEALRAKDGGKVPRTLMEELGLRKHRVHVLSANAPAATLTTLPDDLLHYSEPRILTVREYARLQSFPDWFKFRGKYTTGGTVRKTQCPRYTQIGNAVPPLLAQAIGTAVREALRALAVPPQASLEQVPAAPTEVLEDA